MQKLIAFGILFGKKKKCTEKGFLSSKNVNQDVNQTGFCGIRWASGP
jgi:hypothetical protein